MEVLELGKDENFHVALLLSLLTNRPFSCPNDPSQKDTLRVLRILSPASSHSIKHGVLSFWPGAMLGGKHTIEMPSIPEYLPFLMLFGLFDKQKLSLTLEGATNYQTGKPKAIDKDAAAGRPSPLESSSSSCSMDIAHTIYKRVFDLFKLPTATMEIKRHAFNPLGGGRVILGVTPIRKLEKIAVIETEMLYKVRGLVVTARLNSDVTHRMVSAIKTEVEGLCDSVKVANIAANRNDSGPSPGFEASVMLSGKTSVFYGTASSADSPEDAALQACRIAMASVDHGGFFDRKLNHFLFVLMALAHGQSTLTVGSLDEADERILALLKVFLGISYRWSASGEGGRLILIGCNYVNRAMGM